MPLSNTVYLGGQAPDHTAAGISIAKTRPDPYGAFQQGYDDQQKREAQAIANKTALQNYRQTVIKADLANAMYPDLLKAQQAALSGTGQQYGVSPSVVTPAKTGPTSSGGAREMTPPTDPGTNVTGQSAPVVADPNLPSAQTLMNTPPPVQQAPGMPNTSIPAPNFTPYQSGSPLTSADFNAPVYVPTPDATPVVAPAVAQEPSLLASLSPPGMGGMSGADFGAGDAAAGAGDALEGMDFGDMAGMFG